MATISFSYTVQMEERRCPVCGIAYAVDRFVMAEKEKNKGEFYCPNGHCRVFSESEADRLRKALQEANARIVQSNQARWEAEAAKTKAERKLRKTEKRIAGGVCPCCNRHFVNVERHMKTKHPEKVTA